MALKIYTKTGDKGQTSLFGGKRVPKYHVRVEAYGTVDELNSVIGVIISELNAKHKELKKELIKIQHDLFDIGTPLANPDLKAEKQKEYTKFFEGRIKEFEHAIDGLAEQSPSFQCFVLPGGTKESAYLHLARTVCRRAERKVIVLSKKEHINPSIIIYLNRLSDLLFTMARYVNHKEKKKEIIWEERV